MPNGGSWLARQGASGSKYHRVWGFNYALGLNNSHSVWGFFLYSTYMLYCGAGGLALIPKARGMEENGEKEGRGNEKDKRGKRERGKSAKRAV